MSPDVWFVVLGLIAVTMALGYYTRVELPLREHERRRQAVRAFSRAVELRFPSHEGLSSRVARLSLHVGRAMKLDPWRLSELEMTAWLRDIGLSAIPYRLLNGSSPMSWTEAEAATYARHPDASAAMLELIPELRRYAHPVRCHHANFDGSSGPYFPHGRDLPIESRILKVIGDYVWRERRQGQLLARESLRDGRGKEYDPDIVDAFLGTEAVERLAHTEPNAVPTSR